MIAQLLANENFPAPSVAHLRERGHDVLAIAEVARSLSDLEVLALAVGEKRWILTFDRDYGELVFSRRLPVPPAIFYLRLPSYRPEERGMLVASLLESKRSFAGLFVVIEPTGLRICDRFPFADPHPPPLRRGGDRNLTPQLGGEGGRDGIKINENVCAHWRRVKRGLPPRYRLFFRFSSQPARIIVYAWLNDEATLRKAGAKTDVRGVSADAQAR